MQHIIGGDRAGAIHRGRAGLDEFKRWYAEHTNADGFTGTVDEALRGADVFIGLSGPGAVSVDAVLDMADDAIVFAMANPTPEVPPEDARGSRRRDRHRTLGLPEPDQQRARASRASSAARSTCARSEINEEMKLAAGQALASVVGARRAARPST